MKWLWRKGWTQKGNVKSNKINRETNNKNKKIILTVFCQSIFLQPGSYLKKQNRLVRILLICMDANLRNQAK